MSEIDKLRAAFHSDCHYSDNCLREVFADGTAMTRHICANGYQHLVIRLETQRRPSWFPFFRDHNGLNDTCDFIVFVELADAVYVLLVEMKLGGDDPKPQLTFTENFVKFVLRRMNLHKDLRPEKEYHIRKIGMTDKTPPKNLTKISKETCRHYDADNFTKSYKEGNFILERYVHMLHTSEDDGVIDMEV